MRDLVTNTLHGLNEQLVNGMMGQRTNFKSVGQTMFKSVATTSLEKGEGALMGAMGLGKLGTQSNPMFVKMAEIGSVIGGAAGSAVGKIGGFFGSMLQTILPGLADGGYLNGPAIVGEHGPELFMPSVGGQIIPNYRLSGGGGQDIHFHPGAIDARGSTDPAQVQAMVERGIRAAAPHLTAASI